MIQKNYRVNQQHNNHKNGHNDNYESLRKNKAQVKRSKDNDDIVNSEDSDNDSESYIVES